MRLPVSFAPQYVLLCCASPIGKTRKSIGEGTDILEVGEKRLLGKKLEAR